MLKKYQLVCTVIYYMEVEAVSPEEASMEGDCTEWAAWDEAKMIESSVTEVPPSPSE